MNLLSNLHSYLDAGALAVIVGLYALNKIKDGQIARLTVAKILDEAKAQQDPINAQLQAVEAQTTTLKGEYSHAYANIDPNVVHNDTKPNS